MKLIVPWIPIILLLLIVLLIIRILKRSSQEPLGYMLLGGLLFGLICLFGGMISAVLLAPQSNLMPIIGIIITGPAGLFIGIFAGWWYWRRKKSSAP